MNPGCVRTCPCKWRIKKPFITRMRAGAAKKAAGCGARRASLSYLEPFPVNLGPAFAVVLCIRMHTLVRRTLTRACSANALTRMWWCRTARPLPVRMRVRARVRRCIWLQTRRCKRDNRFSLANEPTIVTIFRLNLRALGNLKKEMIFIE